jgi:teichuronic acid biosynthesis glycosyltransferase TuaC
LTTERELRIASVCRSLPTPDNPSSGVFVFNRLSAMGRQAQVHILQPIPYFPFARPLPSWYRASDKPSNGSPSGATPIAHLPMPYVPGVLKFLDGVWLDRAIHGEIASLHRSRGLDLIDAHFGYPEGTGCSRVALRLNIPLFITVRGFESEFLSRPFIGEQIRQALHSARGIVSVSYSLQALLTSIGIPEDRIEVIHNGIDHETFKPRDKRAGRASVDLGADRPLIVSVGHQVRRKGHHLLIEAFASIRERRPDALLVIIGSDAPEPDYARQLRHQIDTSRLGDSVRLVGNLPPARVAQWLCASDLFVLATAREGCCNAVLEALASGVPVVSTPAGDNKFFVEEGIDGYIVPGDDASALGAAIERSLRTSWDAGAIARRLEAKVGDWDAVATRAIEFFNASLARPERPVRLS